MEKQVIKLKLNKNEKETMVKEDENVLFQPETWIDMTKKYPMERDDMDEETEKRYVKDCFYLYEKEGFSSVFWTPYDDYNNRNGQKIEVIGRCNNENINLRYLPMWNIRFPDGEVLVVGPEEIIPSEMKENGCKLFDDKKVMIDGDLMSKMKNFMNWCADEKDFVSKAASHGFNIEMLLNGIAQTYLESLMENEQVADEKDEKPQVVIKENVEPRKLKLNLIIHQTEEKKNEINQDNEKKQKNVLKLKRKEEVK